MATLLGVNPDDGPERGPERGCVGFGPHPPGCTCIASRTDHAMITPGRDVLYPDDLDQARYYAEQYRARPINPAKFNEFFNVPTPQCPPACSEMHTYSGGCALAPTGRRRTQP